jgi:hypothetical protein
MTWYTRNTGRPWSVAELRRLRTLARLNTPTRVIAFKLGRTPEAVYAMASSLGITLKPVNQSPYGRR